MLKSKPFRIFLKTVASLWILYHLFVIIVMPNAGSFVGRVFQSYITPYSNTLGFSSAWNFFSPDPAHTMYVHYFVYFTNEDGDELKESIEGYFPKEKNKGTFDPRLRRDFYLMHFLLLNPNRVGTLLVPYLCRSNPGASFVKAEFVVETIPPLDQMMTMKDDSQNELSKKLQYVKQEYPCRVE
ncbi:MAG: hypothetical protein EOP09_09645 [Proteobacteria bacterium]|nr:MAG: hypothetical protein EOP09_09645 [Pseudomonadota bacterium]